METLDVKINIDFAQLSSIVKQLNPSENLKLNEIIWNDEMEIPEEHKQLVLSRVKKARKNQNRLIAWDKAVKLLRP
jgi:hypothetical protein